ncbi:MAG: hypothetical protein ACLRFE_01405 [Clostridia bacterium]
MFDYIEENLEKIKNPNDVNIIKPAKLDRGYELWARINNGEKIQLTEPKSKMTFPFEPIYWLAREQFGKFYFKDFGMIDNYVAINKNHLKELQYLDSQKLDPKGKRVGLYVCFDDGLTIFLAEPTKKYFLNKLKPEMEQKFGMQFKDVTQEAIDKKELEKYL